VIDRLVELALRKRLVMAMICGFYACVGARLPGLDPALIGAKPRGRSPGPRAMPMPARPPVTGRP